jgi:hypothetical protein
VLSSENKISFKKADFSLFYFDLTGGRLRARGGAAAPRVAFLRKKLRKNLLGKRFFGGQWGKCEHRPPIPEGARPVFAEGKDRLAVGVSFLGPIFLWAKRKQSQ